MGLWSRCEARRAFGLCTRATVLLLCLLGTRVSAEDGSMLVRLLSHAESFRVRARAAIALAHIDDGRAIGALEAALLDPHAAVRTAAAAALGQIGTRRSVPALREAAADSSPSVAQEAKSALRAIAAREAIAHALPTATTDEATLVRTSLQAKEQAEPSLSHVRYAVVLGEMRNRSDLPDGELAVFLGERIGQELRKLDQVAVFSLSEMTEAVAQELLRRKVPTFRLEGNLSRIASGREADQYKIRCEVSLLLMDEPERTLRGLMKGAATQSEQETGAADARHTLLAHKTLQSAVRSAMSNASQAIEAAAVKRALGTGDMRAEASLAHEASQGRARP